MAWKSEDPNVIIRDLKQQLAEAETLRALGNGEVDAVVTAGPGGSRVTIHSKVRTSPTGCWFRRWRKAPDHHHRWIDPVFKPAIRRYYQTPLERVIGCKVYEFLDPECLETARALIDSARRENVKGEIRLRKTDGRMFPAYVSLNRLHIEGLDGFCMVVTDLTEQKRNEELAVAEKLARSILEQAAETILVLDLEGRIYQTSRQRITWPGVLLQKVRGGLPNRSRRFVVQLNISCGRRRAEPLK
jgi:PAS domain-containing protein